MALKQLWQGMIMNRKIQEMAKIREVIQGSNQERQYELADMPQIAEMILKELEIDKVPVPIVAIMKSLNFQVISGAMSDEISGVIGIDDNLQRNFESGKVVAVNCKDNVGHQRFTIAHELAHYLFDFDVSNNIVYYNEYNTDEAQSHEEKRANYFAANLLMPERIFREEFKKEAVKNNLYVTVEKLSDIFQVSGEAVRRRIEELSLPI